MSTTTAAVPESAERKERIAEIAAREAAATAGPWGFYDGDTYANVAADLQMTGRGSYSCRQQIARLDDEDVYDDQAQQDWDEDRASEQMAANAAFIAAAREDVPWLLAELAKARAEAMTEAANWLDGIGQDHAAILIRYYAVDYETGCEADAEAAKDGESRG